MAAFAPAAFNQPSGVVIHPTTGEVYAANGGAANVRVMNAATGATISTPSVGTGNAANDADPDHAGLLNLFEHATGTLPSLPNASPCTCEISGSYLTVTVSKAAGTSVTWSAESCDDLVSWSSAGVTVLIDDAGTFQVRDNVQAVGGTRRFLRLRVSVP